MTDHDSAVLAAIPNGEDNPRLAVVQANLAHDLCGGALRAGMPPLYSTDGTGDAAVVHFKCFTPWSNWTWYALEYDPDEGVCFGLVVGHEVELGTFSLCELLEIRGPYGLQIERDLHWTPKPLADVRREVGRNR